MKTNKTYNININDTSDIYKDTSLRRWPNNISLDITDPMIEIARSIPSQPGLKHRRLLRERLPNLVKVVLGLTALGAAAVYLLSY